MWRWFSVQRSADQPTLFEGFVVPSDLSVVIGKALADLSVPDKWKYASHWVRIRPFAHQQRLLPRDGLVGEILSLIKDDIAFAQEDEELTYKLCAFSHGYIYNVLSSFRHKDAPVDWGWLQREYTVLRKGQDVFSLFMPKP